MAGIALLLDLLKKNPSVSGQALHSYGLFSATVAASAAAASVAAGKPFASRFLFRCVDWVCLSFPFSGVVWFLDSFYVFFFLLVDMLKILID